MNTTGSEALYELTMDEAWPVLCLREAERKEAPDDGVVALPAPLVRRLEAARVAEREAVNEIARWVKYGSDPVAKLNIQQIIDELPTADERKKARKK